MPTRQNDPYPIYDGASTFTDAMRQYLDVSVAGRSVTEVMNGMRYTHPLVESANDSGFDDDDDEGDDSEKQSNNNKKKDDKKFMFCVFVLYFSYTCVVAVARGQPDSLTRSTKASNVS